MIIQKLDQKPFKNQKKMRLWEKEKQMLQSLPITLAQVKAGNNSENL